MTFTSLLFQATPKCYYLVSGVEHIAYSKPVTGGKLEAEAYVRVCDSISMSVFFPITNTNLFHIFFIFWHLFYRFWNMFLSLGSEMEINRITLVFMIKSI